MTNAVGEKRGENSETAHVYANVYRVLMAGMFLSTTFFGIGVVLALLKPAFVPLTADWVRAHYHWAVVLAGLRAGDPAAFMLVGTLLLILTPITRVVVSIYVFLVERDYKYAAITSLVLAIITLTVVLSRFGLQQKG